MILNKMNNRLFVDNLNRLDTIKQSACSQAKHRYQIIFSRITHTHKSRQSLPLVKIAGVLPGECDFLTNGFEFAVVGVGG